MKQVYLVLLFCLTYSFSFAWHIIGTDITYQHLIGNSYEITLIVYRDCNQTQGAPFDNPLNYEIFKNNSLISSNVVFSTTTHPTLPDSLTGSCNLDSSGICVEYATYIDTVLLNSTSGTYEITYQRCCRSENISNLLQPQAQGSTWQTTLHHLGGGNFANNSPTFINHMPVGFCYNDTFSYSQAVTEADGDSLVYRLSNPTIGGSQSNPYPSGPGGMGASPPPYTNVNWAPGYDYQNQLGTTASFSIDQNGIISGYTNQQGRYSLAYAVDEYRAGTLIGTIRRDFAVYIVDTAQFSIPVPEEQDTTNGIPEIPVTIQQGVFPNPSNGEFGIIHSAPFTVVSSVYDINGNKMSFAKIDDNRYVINQSQIKSGMYFVKCHQADKTKILKLYIAR